MRAGCSTLLRHEVGVVPSQIRLSTNYLKLNPIRKHKHFFLKQKSSYSILVSFPIENSTQYWTQPASIYRVIKTNFANLCAFAYSTKATNSQVLK